MVCVTRLRCALRRRRRSQTGHSGDPHRSPLRHCPTIRAVSRSFSSPCRQRWTRRLRSALASSKVGVSARHLFFHDRRLVFLLRDDLLRFLDLLLFAMINSASRSSLPMKCGGQSAADPGSDAPGHARGLEEGLSFHELRGSAGASRAPSGPSNLGHAPADVELCVVATRFCVKPRSPLRR
jgi:hypothetical protein